MLHFYLKQLIDQLPVPFLLLGDFNAHNPIWGSSKQNDNGKKVEDLLNKEGLCIFNDGSSTYLHPGYGTFSSIDLSICDPSILLDYSWSVHHDLCGSDHFPIILKNLFQTSEERLPRYKFDKADWSKFQTLCSEEITLQSIENTDDPILTFNKKLTTIADQTIPKTSTKPKKPNKPWYTDECEKAIKDRNKAQNKFNKHPTPQNLSNFRVFRAKARRT